MTGRDLVYWDTCIFLAFIKNETRKDPNDMQGILDIVAKIERGNVGLVTSVITLAEVLESTLSQTAIDIFQSYLLRPDMILVDVDKRIAQISHEIRDFYQRKKLIDGINTVAVPDAIHLATAISKGCKVFYTFDGDGGQDSNKSRILLTLGQNIAGTYDLHIEKPSPSLQLRLPKFGGNPIS